MKIGAGDVIALRNVRGHYRITSVDWRRKEVHVAPSAGSNQGRPLDPPIVPFAGIQEIIRPRPGVEEG